MKTNKLAGAALDWAVAKCEGEEVRLIKGQIETLWTDNGYKPSTDWSMAGPIIERECIAMWPDEEGGFLASANEGAGRDFHGETYLIAACRCYVASKLGDEIEIPAELTTGD